LENQKITKSDLGFTQKAQAEVGNCSWASSKTAFLALLTVYGGPQKKTAVVDFYKKFTKECRGASAAAYELTYPEGHHFRSEFIIKGIEKQKKRKGWITPPRQGLLAWLPSPFKK
jgi:hypothetical protein